MSEDLRSLLSFMTVLKAFVEQSALCMLVLVGVVVRSKRLRSVLVSPCNLSVVISLPFSSLDDLHSSEVTGCCWYSLFKHSSLHLDLLHHTPSPVFLSSFWVTTFTSYFSPLLPTLSLPYLFHLCNYLFCLYSSASLSHLWNSHLFAISLSCELSAWFS